MNTRYNLETLSAYINPYISDYQLALDLLEYVYDIIDVRDYFIEYDVDGRLYTRTGLITEFAHLEPNHIAAKRWMYRDVFTNQLGCIREECGGLRQQLLSGLPQHTVIWGMSPQSVVCLCMNMDKYFNFKLSTFLDTPMPGYFSLPAIFSMIRE